MIWSRRLDAEVPEMVYPIFGQTVRELRAQCGDAGSTHDLVTVWYIPYIPSRGGGRNKVPIYLERGFWA